MAVAVASSHRFLRTPDGAVWTQTMFAQPFWERYLDVFDRVKVVARVQDVPEPPAGHVRADGFAVSFAAVPYYVGPWQYLPKALAIRTAVRTAVKPSDAVILRVSSQVAGCLYRLLRRACRPYGVQVVGDPWDVFAPGVVPHPLRPFFRRHFSRELRNQCAHACAAAYVTKSALQRRYPASPDALSTDFSDVELHSDSFRLHPRSFPWNSRRLRLVTVGTLEQLYKAPDILIEAASRCVAEGLALEVVFVGDGQYRSQLEDDVRRRGMADRIRFVGQLQAGELVRRELDGADLFVLPSRTEGLPRALIEAMARGLPSIGSAVGGIPELLPAEDLVPPGNAVALAAKIREVVADRERMGRMSARNLKKASEYREESLRLRRVAFFSYVRERTERWLRNKAA